MRRTPEYVSTLSNLQGVTVSHHDWSLHRKGPADQARHQEKVKEAIKQNLGGIVSEESIITQQGGKIVRIPIRELELPHFRYDPRKQRHAGQGTGDSQIGDVIGQDPGQSNAPGRGRRAGERPGIDYYEAEMTIDELAALIFEDLGLPRLQQKSAENMEVETTQYTDIRRTGPLGNLDKKRTILENMKKNAVKTGTPFYGNLSMDDLRFRTRAPTVRRETNAVVIAMRDVSGSMGEFEKYVTRSFYFWMVRFLRTKYQNVDIRFITHHTEAKEVDEETFFKLGESGGTKVSSAYTLANKLIDERYNPSRFNIFPFHFSDGDNWGDTDNQECIHQVRRMLPKSNQFGYAEIRNPSYGNESSTLMLTFQQGGLMDDPRFVASVIRDRKDIYPTLKTFFHLREGQEGSVSRA